MQKPIDNEVDESDLTVTVHGSFSWPFLWGKVSMTYFFFKHGDATIFITFPPTCVYIYCLYT